MFADYNFREEIILLSNNLLLTSVIAQMEDELAIELCVRGCHTYSSIWETTVREELAGTRRTVTVMPSCGKINCNYGMLL